MTDSLKRLAELTAKTLLTADIMSKIRYSMYWTCKNLCPLSFWYNLIMHTIYHIVSATKKFGINPYDCCQLHSPVSLGNEQQILIGKKNTKRLKKET